MEDKKIAIHAIPFDSEVSIDKETGHEVYDRVAHAQDLADWWAAYYSNGILVRGTDLLTNELQVLHLSAMACVVKPGMLVINGRTGIMKEELQLSFDVGESQPRIDRVVAELNLADRNVYIRILKGTPASSPQPVEITQNDDLYQIPLAQVHINAQQAAIASVTDERKEYISNVLLNKAPNTDVDASQVKVSDAVKSLYGLSTDNQNVDKALEKMQKGGLLSSVLTGFVKNSARGEIYAGDTLLNALNKLENKIQFTTGTLKLPANGTKYPFKVGIPEDTKIILLHSSVAAGIILPEKHVAIGNLYNPVRASFSDGYLAIEDADKRIWDSECYYICVRGQKVIQ